MPLEVAAREVAEAIEGRPDRRSSGGGEYSDEFRGGVWVDAVGGV